MATLVNRDWYTVDAHGRPLKVHCLSHNIVLGTARVVTDDGVFAEIDARLLHHEPADVTACSECQQVVVSAAKDCVANSPETAESRALPDREVA